MFILLQYDGSAGGPGTGVPGFLAAVIPTQSCQCHDDDGLSLLDDRIDMIKAEMIRILHFDGNLKNMSHVLYTPQSFQDHPPPIDIQERLPVFLH